MNNATPNDLPSTSTSNEPSNNTTPAQAQTKDAVAQTPAQKRILLQAKKRSEFTGFLMNNLDMLIYVELCVMYYMDCSLFRLLLRVLPQMMFLTPKPSFIPPAPQHRPYIGAIFGPNIICMLLHIFTRRPEAGEAMRGYLHGGVIIDLIGQKGPSSKIHLVLLDIVVLALQCFMLAVNAEKERLSSILAASASRPAASGSGSEQPRAEIATTQDHDAEERGVMRDEIVTNNGAIEMQSLTPRNNEASSSGAREELDEERNEERERLLAEPPPRQEDEDDHALDVFWSGTAVLADFHILYNLKRQYADYGSATESALQTVGFQAELAAVTADRRFRRGVRSLTA